MAFQICKLVAGRSVWLKKEALMVTWWPRTQATLFPTKGDARRTVNDLPTKDEPVGIVEDEAPSN
jgi:hypothetical protein